MEILSKEVYVIRVKGTDDFRRQTGEYCDINGPSKSPLKTFETKAQAKNTIIRRFHDHYDFLKVRVTIEEV